MEADHVLSVAAERVTHKRMTLLKSMGFWLTVGIVAFVAMVVWVTAAEENEWSKFSKLHHCRVVSTTRSRTVPVVTFGGKGGASFGAADIPSVTCWACDDGQEHCR